MLKRILIVEDEFIVANALRLTLEQAGYTVDGIAVSSEEAEQLLQTKKPDLVLLDIRLNGKQTGIDIAKHLSALNIAFVYLSANSSQKVLEQAKATEPHGFLVKPYREKDLLIMLDIAWYRHRHSLEARLRNEEALQKRLAGILIGDTTMEQKLFKIVRSLQSYIPFDLVVFGERFGKAAVKDIAYLRTGFDEYQYLGENEVEVITGKPIDMLSPIIERPDGNTEQPFFHHGLGDGSAFEKTMSDSFKIESYLSFPVVLSGGGKAYYCFYSRQREVYTQSHIKLLDRLGSCLNRVTRELLEAQDTHRVLSQRVMSDKGSLHSRDVNHPEFAGIIGTHPLLLTALDMTLQVAPYSTSVLILGESGTGKEKIAQAIHQLSSRKNKPFIKVNCAAIPDTLIESELFGHEKGAFTGAVDKRVGRFEQADGGTIFLDEIGELPLEMQVKLLRVLQERVVDPIGGHSPKKVDVRIVAATSRNLEKEVASGGFRLDLYYRLNVFPITLPALRERKNDIPELVNYFAMRFAKNFNKDIKRVATSMIDEMCRYNWPGNIRELENMVERSVILHQRGAELQLQSAFKFTGNTGTSSQTHVANFDDVKKIQRDTERSYIISVLKKADGRIRGVNGAAELLNMKPTTLESKMAKLGIKKEDFINAGGV